MLSYNRDVSRARLFVATISAAACAISISLRASSSSPDIPSVLVSRQLFVSEKLSIGDLITVATDRSGANARRFRVAGSYEPIPDPMRLGAVRHEMRMHLPDLVAMTADPGDLMSADTVDVINVAQGARGWTGGKAGKGGRGGKGGQGEGTELTEMLAKDLTSRIPGVLARPTAVGDDRTSPFVVLERFHLAIAIVTVVASSIFLLALMLMLVDERRSTVGILRLIGYRRRRILLYVLAEGLIIAAAGAVIGIVIAAGFQGAVNRFFQWRYDTALIFVRITPAIALQSIAMAVPLGILAAVAASWTLLRGEVFTLTRR